MSIPLLLLNGDVVNVCAVSESNQGNSEVLHKFGRIGVKVVVLCPGGFGGGNGNMSNIRISRKPGPYDLARKRHKYVKSWR